MPGGNGGISRFHVTYCVVDSETSIVTSLMFTVPLTEPFRFVSTTMVMPLISTALWLVVSPNVIDRFVVSFVMVYVEFIKVGVIAGIGITLYVVVFELGAPVPEKLQVRTFPFPVHAKFVPSTENVAEGFAELTDNWLGDTLKQLPI